MRRSRAPSFFVVGTVLCLATTSLTVAENIDPDGDGAQYAYAENVGWLNAEPSGGGEGMQVGDSELSGWMWGENIGWVSLSCKNTLSCATTDYGILNDGNGTVSGHAWAENVGWIDFAPSTSGVNVDPATGAFSGYAWGENIGWISLSSANPATRGTVEYGVKSAWICDPLPAAPSLSPDLSLGKVEAGTLLSWDLVPGATGSDLVRGDLSCLLANNGDFSLCTMECLDDNRTTTTMMHAGTPAVGDPHWFLVRGQNCGGSGTYGTTERDTEIAISGADCP